ncbi:hypothetical protein ACET3Z_023337 [Daucus carota]
MNDNEKEFSFPSFNYEDEPVAVSLQFSDNLEEISPQPWRNLHEPPGFRKIDTDKWEFANECFLRGKRHLLKNILRRRTTHSQQTENPSSDLRKAQIEDEIERLRKERGMMMQEVIELQQQHHCTVQHMEAVNEKLQAAEQKQKQMISFLANVFQHPEFLARLQRKDKGSIVSPRTAKKFAKHQETKPPISALAMEEQIFKFEDNLENSATAYENPHSNLAEQIVHSLKQETVENPGFSAEVPSCRVQNIVQSHNMAVQDGLPESLEEVRRGIPDLGPNNSLFVGNKEVSCQQDHFPEYFVCSPYVCGKDNSYPELMSPGFGFEELGGQFPLNLGSEAGPSISNSNTAVLGNLSNNNVAPEFGASGGMSGIWDVSSLQVAVGSEFDMWHHESSLTELEDQVGQPKSDNSETERVNP